MTHIYNNPVQHVAVCLLSEGSKARRAEESGLLPSGSAKLRIARRWQRALFLLRNPWAIGLQFQGEGYITDTELEEYNPHGESLRRRHGACSRFTQCFRAKARPPKRARVLEAALYIHE